jgi:geranylgeranyl diphosphate synthase type II
MIGLSAQLGGILSNLHIGDISKLNNYGKLIGRAFQVQDDLLEILSTSWKMGKTLDSDFILGKKTYLMIEAKRLYPLEYAKIIDLSLKDNKKGFKKFKELLDQTGLINDCKDYIHDTFLKADKVIDTIAKNQNLKKFTSLIKNRKF